MNYKGLLDEEREDGCMFCGGCLENGICSVCGEGSVNKRGEE